jgi:hypothetical protein
VSKAIKTAPKIFAFSAVLNSILFYEIVLAYRGLIVARVAAAAAFANAMLVSGNGKAQHNAYYYKGYRKQS